MFYFDKNDVPEDLAEQLADSNEVPYVERPVSGEPTPITGEHADKLVGMWRSFKHDTGENKKPHLWIRELTPQEIREIESLEKKKALNPTA